MAAAHAANPEPEPAPPAGPATEEEAMAALQAAFPDAEVTHIPHG